MVRTLLKPFSFVPALLLMYMIYSFSAQPGEVSSQLSYKVSYKIVETVDQALNAQMADWEIDTWVYRIHGLVRKLAHMTEYFALAVAVSFPLYVYGVRGIWLMLLAGFICVGFACGDEYHQSFVEGRGPSKRDVAIDSFGVFWGIILVRIVGWTGRKTIFRPRKKRSKHSRESQVNPQMQQNMQVPPYQPQQNVQVPPYQPQQDVQAQTYRPQQNVQVPPYQPQQDVQAQTYRPQQDVQVPPYRPQQDVQPQAYRPQQDVQPQSHEAPVRRKYQQPHPQQEQNIPENIPYRPYTQSYQCEDKASVPSDKP